MLRIKRLTSKGQGHKVVLNVSVKMIAGLLAFVGTLRVAEGFIGMSPTRCSLGNSFIPPADAAAAAAAVAVDAGMRWRAARTPVSMMAATTTQAGTQAGYDLRSWAKVSQLPYCLWFV